MYRDHDLINTTMMTINTEKKISYGLFIFTNKKYQQFFIFITFYAFNLHKDQRNKTNFQLTRNALRAFYFSYSFNLNIKYIYKRTIQLKIKNGVHLFVP